MRDAEACTAHFPAGSRATAATVRADDPRLAGREPAHQAGARLAARAAVRQPRTLTGWGGGALVHPWSRT